MSTPASGVGRSAPIRYSFAVVVAFTVFAIRAALSGVLGNTVPFITFFPGVMLSAWFGGLGAGVLTTFLTAGATAFLVMEPNYAWRLETRADYFALAVYLAVGIAVSAIQSRLRMYQERTRAAELAERQLRLLSEQTLGSIGDAVISTDTAGRVEFVNAAAERLTGWNVADAKGQPIESVFDIVTERTENRPASPVRRVLAEGVVLGLANHTELITRSGERIPIDDSGAPIRDGNGDVVGTVLVFRDITERRHAERRLTTTLESISDGFVALDGSWCYTYVNPPAARMMNRTAESLIGKCLWNEYPELHGTPVEAAYRRVVEERVPVQFDYERLQSWYEAHVYPAADGGLSIYFQDITAKKQAEEREREIERRMRNLADANAIGVVFSEVSGRVHYANDEFLRIIGYTREQFEAGLVNWRNLTPAELWERDNQGLDEAKLKGHCSPYEKEYRRPDGTRIPVLVGYTLDGQDARQSVAFILDLTERKKLENELRDNARVLQRINEDLQQFSYAASHDLQEPLRMVTSYVQLLEHRYGPQLDEDARSMIRVAVDGAVRMSQLINGLLEYSRAGQVTNEPLRPVDVEPVLKSVLRGLKMALEDTKAVVTYDPLPTVSADELHISQLLQNLISNGIKYARKGETPRVHIRAEATGGTWQFSVTDNGIGIEPQHQKKIFGVFRRLHGPEIAGTGIGLATCKRIVELYGGAIWVESEPEKGSTFRFTLPAASNAAQSAGSG